MVFGRPLRLLASTPRFPCLPSLRSGACDRAPSSPAYAVNRGLAAARGKIIGVMIDGARIVTPGFLHFARSGAGLYRRAVVASLGWYLGLDIQRWAIECKYNQKREDALLASIGWPQDGYRLFEIAALDESSVDGWFHRISESNGLFLSSESWDLLGGFDERFDSPGGGLLNLDIMIRALEMPERELVILLGEATFHQIHGGIATNAEFRIFPQKFNEWRQQYESIRQKPWAVPEQVQRTYIGTLPQPALVQFARAIVEPVHGAPLGTSFDRTLWTITPPPRPADPLVASLVDLAENEFRGRRFEASAAVARMARNRAPDEPAPQRILANAGIWLRDDGEPPEARRKDFHLARGKAFHLLGDRTAAASEYRLALTFDHDLEEAYVGLSSLRLPGEDYLIWLARLHDALLPKTYVEIGIEYGHSLGCARPPTRAIGVDPEPSIQTPFKTETHIFCETSDAFFANERLTPLLDGRPLDFAFIDGLHLFEQTLKDFINLEPHCGSNSVILVHDTSPLDASIQTRTRTTKFWAGDVWKIVPCLRHYRPDLNIITIATPPTGLTMITRLDPTSRVLSDRYDEAVSRFIDTPYSEIESRLESVLNIVPNDWHVVEARLKAAAII